MSIHIKGITFLASLLLASAAFAAEGTSERFQKLDLDGDGRISSTEASRDPQLSAQWDQIEKKDDNYMDRSEFSAFETMEEGKTGE
jgi:hypothetical protein